MKHWLALLLFVYSSALLAQPLPGTDPMTTKGDLASLMVDGIDEFLKKSWQLAAQENANAGTRDQLRSILGISSTPAARTLETTAELSPGKPAKFRLRIVRWLAAEGFDGSDLLGEGFLFEPVATSRNCLTIILPDADEAVEKHIAAGAPAAWLAKACKVLVLPIFDLGTAYAGNPAVKMITQPHREFLWRMGFPIGKHVIGLDVDKLLTAIDALASSQTQVHVQGGGEGALVAMYAAYVDPRINTLSVPAQSDPFPPVWQQPIYRSIWKQLPNFRESAVRAVLAPRLRPAEPLGAPLAITQFDDNVRTQRQMRNAINYLQSLIRHTERSRNATWAPEYKLPLAQWQLRKPALQDLFVQHQGELALDRAKPPRVATQTLSATSGYTMYQVQVPVRDSIFASGLLLVPKGLRPGERRALVVVQHGLESRDMDMVNPESEQQQRTYRRLGALLAERGFIVYAPQNPYLFGERFRTLSRKAVPFGHSLFTFITAQHRRTLDWLETLPFVDAGRIGYYGLSYGGRTAMMVGSIEERYKVVVCSGNFNEWLWKVTTIDQPFSYMFTKEHEIFEWNVGPRWGHAELALLMAPRAFFVERGHNDGVGIDEWVSYEFAKVRRQYRAWGIPEQTEIEYFQGPHMIFADKAVDFLEAKLRHP